MTEPNGPSPRPVPPPARPGSSAATTIEDAGDVAGSHPGPPPVSVGGVPTHNSAPPGQIASSASALPAERKRRVTRRPARAATAPSAAAAATAGPTTAGPTAATPTGPTSGAGPDSARPPEAAAPDNGSTTALPSTADSDRGPGRSAQNRAPSAIDQYATLAAADRAAAEAGRPIGTPTPVDRDTRGTRPPPRRGPERVPRRARLQLRHLSVWSVLKFSCVLAIALFLVWLIMIAVLYGLLDKLDVFSRVNETIRTINGDDTTKNYITSNIIFYGALIIGMVNMVLFIILTTIGSLVYNLCADLVGGIEVTLAERD